MREPWIFYTAAGENNFVFWGSQNGAIYITYTFFTHLAAGEKIRVFLGVKMVPYIQILEVFLGGQNGAIYTHFEFFLGENAAIYTHLGFFWGQNATICTHFVA